MSGNVAVVTDSTAYLPAELAERHRITVVPLQVVLGRRSLAEGTEVTSAQVAEALRSDVPVTTSRPAPQVFVETYRRLRAEGAAAVVSIHLSGDMSGTVDAARIAAKEVAEEGLRVEVVDSRSLGMGLGYAAVTAAEAAAAGEAPDEVSRRGALRAFDAGVFLFVDTLEYLRRGGRIGAARAWLGSALAVKPVLHLVDGRLEPLERVRTTERAAARLVEVAVAEAGEKAVDLTVHHLAAAERAERVADQLRERLPAAREITVAEIGAVVGAHVGPGAVGVIVSPVTPGR